MNNKQLAAARRVMASYPTLMIDKSGEKLTPYLKSQPHTEGAVVTVSDTMGEGTVAQLLAVSCEALVNG